MKLCRSCGGLIPGRIKIDGRQRNLNNRTNCLNCVPFGMGNEFHRHKQPYAERNREKAKKWYYRKKLEIGESPTALVRRDNKQLILDLVDGKCQLCPYNRTYHALHFHHLYRKDFNLSTRTFATALPKLLPELKKCIVVCGNCHAEIHIGLISESRIIECSQAFSMELELIQFRSWSEWKSVS